MNTYLISYDLRNNRDYNVLYDWIRSYKTYSKILESLWVIKTNKNSQTVYNHLSTLIDSDDWIFIVKSWREANWNNVLSTSEWLQK